MLWGRMRRAGSFFWLFADWVQGQAALTRDAPVGASSAAHPGKGGQALFFWR
jgi:hypothetical protein